MKNSLKILLAGVAAFLFALPVFGQGAMPHLIAKHDLDRYVKYLQPSDEQMAQINRLHQDYLANWKESFDDEISSFNAAWGAVYVDPNSFQEESMEKTYREARLKAEQLGAKLRLANDSFFDEIEVLLSDQQTPGLQRARLAHERFSYKRDKQGLRERHIDLVAIIERMNLSEPDAGLALAVIVDFEPVYVQALRTAAESEQRGQEFSFGVLDILRQFPNGGMHSTAQAQADALKEKAGKLKYSASRRLVETNRGGLRRLMSVLSPASAADLERHYLYEAYPEVYPDPMFAGPLYEAALKITDLTEEQKNAFESLQQQYLSNHARLSQQLAEAIFNKRAIQLRCEAGVRQRGLQAEQKIRELGYKREKLNLAQPMPIRSALLPEQNADLAPWRFEESPPVRFWGRLADLSSDELKATEKERQRLEEEERLEQSYEFNRIRQLRGLPTLGPVSPPPEPPPSEKP